MRITFVTRKFGNVERNSHCDVLHITPIRVARLFLDCNGDFAIRAYREANCPAFTATCNKCSLTGHFSAMCRKRTPQKWGKADKLSSTPYSGYNEKMTTKSEDSASATDQSVYEEICGASISHPAGLPPTGLVRATGTPT